MVKPPLVSVVMSAYNAERYIKEAIDSILNQTFTDFEFIIIDDGSTDGTLKIIKSYKDPRIVLIGRENKGLVASLNEGIKKARGKYIARMDADDISMPERFAKQVDYLEGHPEVGLIGGQFAVINNKGDVTTALVSRPIDDKDARLLLGYGTVFAHASVMFKDDLIEKIGFYDEKKYLAEDHDLWCRMAKVTKMYNLPEVVLQYRIVEDGVSLSNDKKQVDVMNKISDDWRSYYNEFDKIINPFLVLGAIIRYRIYAQKMRGYTLKVYYYELINHFIEDIRKDDKNYNSTNITLCVMKMNRKLIKYFG